MEDCVLFNVGSTEIWSVVISMSSIICVYQWRLVTQMVLMISTGFEPVTSRNRSDALPTEL